MADQQRRVRVPCRRSALAADLEFPGSAHRSLGLELEFQIVDPVTKDLVPLGPRVIAAAAHDPALHNRVHKELMQNTVELITGARADGTIPTSVAELRADMARTIAAVREITESLGGELVLAASHPFANPGDQEFTEDERIVRLVEDIGKPLRDLQTWGLHVHVGVPDGDAAIRAQNHLNRYLGHFLALSGSSPFWNGHDTGMVSYRSPTFESMRLTGPPPPMNEWDDYTQRFRHLLSRHRIADGGVEDPWAGNKDIHWDVRPSPRYGTVELRVCDATPTLREAMAIVALTQCLVEEAVRQRATPLLLSDFSIRENKSRAAESGLDALLDVPGRVRGVPVREDIARTVKRLQPIARQLGCATELNDVLRILAHGPSAQRQRTSYRDDVARQSLTAPTSGSQPTASGLNRGAAVAVIEELQRELLTDTVAARHFAAPARGGLSAA